MPRGPQGQKRPADVIGAAVMVGRLATGEETEELKKPSGKVKSGQAGAKARAEKLTADERTAMTRPDARAVANFILEEADRQGKQLALMQVIKLAYLAQGWHLSGFEKPLFNDKIEAWQYGPVIPVVYRALAGSGYAPVTKRAVDPVTGLPYSHNFSDGEKKLLAAIVKSYGDKHAFQLSERMHQPGTPWSQTKESKGLYSEIPFDLIAKHFDELRERNRAKLLTETDGE